MTGIGIRGLVRRPEAACEHILELAHMGGNAAAKGCALERFGRMTCANRNLEGAYPFWSKADDPLVQNALTN